MPIRGLVGIHIERARGHARLLLTHEGEADAGMSSRWKCDHNEQVPPLAIVAVETPFQQAIQGSIK